jgi:hypothetical protein
MIEAKSASIFIKFLYLTKFYPLTSFFSQICYKPSFFINFIYIKGSSHL